MGEGGGGAVHTGASAQRNRRGRTPLEPELTPDVNWPVWVLGIELFSVLWKHTMLLTAEQSLQACLLWFCLYRDPSSSGPCLKDPLLSLLALLGSSPLHKGHFPRKKAEQMPEARVCRSGTSGALCLPPRKAREPGLRGPLDSLKPLLARE